MNILYSLHFESLLMTSRPYVIFCVILSHLKFTRQLKQQEKQENWRKC